MFYISDYVAASGRLENLLVRSGSQLLCVTVKYHHLQDKLLAIYYSM